MHFRSESLWCCSLQYIMFQIKCLEGDIWVRILRKAAAQTVDSETGEEPEFISTKAVCVCLCVQISQLSGLPRSNPAQSAPAQPSDGHPSTLRWYRPGTKLPNLCSTPWGRDGLASQGFDVRFSHIFNTLREL